MRLCLIVAMSANRVIGRDNALPWHISADLKNFKRLTLGKPVVMGRRTFESIGRPLPGRPNIVLTRDRGFRADGVAVRHDLDGALALARRLAAEAGADEVMVIGGAQLYALTLPRADRLYLTRVDARIEGDAFFPAIDDGDWVEAARADHAPEAPSAPAFSIVTLERAPNPGPWRKCVSDALEAAQDDLAAAGPARPRR